MSKYNTFHSVFANILFVIVVLLRILLYYQNHTINLYYIYYYVMTCSQKYSTLKYLYLCLIIFSEYWLVWTAGTKESRKKKGICVNKWSYYASSATDKTPVKEDFPIKEIFDVIRLTTTDKHSIYTNRLVFNTNKSIIL